MDKVRSGSMSPRDNDHNSPASIGKETRIAGERNVTRGGDRALERLRVLQVLAMTLEKTNHAGDDDEQECQHLRQREPVLHARRPFHVVRVDKGEQHCKGETIMVLISIVHW